MGSGSGGGLGALFGVASPALPGRGPPQAGPSRLSPAAGLPPVPEPRRASGRAALPAVPAAGCEVLSAAGRASPSPRGDGGR